jgi:hypothetical protein
MPEEWFEVAYINFDKAILHGRATVGQDEFGCRKAADVEQVLTGEQKEQLVELNERHARETERLLAGFVDRSALA